MLTRKTIVLIKPNLIASGLLAPRHWPRPFSTKIEDDLFGEAK